MIAVHVPARDCVPAPAGLTGWWPGDGNAKDIGGTNNGTLQGGATASVTGLVNSAFSFDGTNGYVSIPDSPVFHPTNLTVEYWVRFTSLDSQGSGGSLPGDQYVVFKQNSRTNNFEGFDLRKIRVDGTDIFKFAVTSASAQVAELHATNVVATGVWYHVAGVRGSNYTQLYVNGQLEGQTNADFPQDYGTLPLYFGTSGESYWDHKLKGVLDEVSLYNRALSAGEIAAIYSAGASGKCKVPTLLSQPQDQLGYWGGSAAFAVAVAGANPLGYQWQNDTVPVAGATVTSLLLTNLQLTNAGGYALQVTNVYGSATSRQAVLTMKVADLLISRSGLNTQPVAALTIGGLVNQTYGVEIAAGLGQTSGWIGLTNLKLNTPTNVWYDSGPATLTQRFYRVVPGPIPIP